MASNGGTRAPEMGPLSEQTSISPLNVDLIRTNLSEPFAFRPTPHGPRCNACEIIEEHAPGCPTNYALRLLDEYARLARLLGDLGVCPECECSAEFSPKTPCGCSSPDCGCPEINATREEADDAE